MKYKTGILLVLIIALSLPSYSTQNPTEVYLLTCVPGPESYTLYGHSALRLVDTQVGTDMVYNWGVFDFTTPNFNLKFARGRLDYLLAAYPYTSFLREYSSLERKVYSQRVSMQEEDIDKLKKLLADNLKPENVAYKYDFFWDNCATRIRDIFEKVYGERMQYPEDQEKSLPTYRNRLHEYHGNVLWMNLGMDLLLGSPADGKCGFRESMFLPDYLMGNLDKVYIMEDDKTVKLLEPAITVLDYEMIEYKDGLFRQPWVWMSLGFLLLLVFTFRVKNRLVQNGFDILFWFILSLLALLMVFVNYLTDHVSMGQNFNLIWLNPLIPIALYAIFAKNALKWFWRSQIAFSIIFMIVIIVISQAINPGFIPVILLIIARSYYRLTL